MYSSSIPSGFTVIRLTTDTLRGTSVPVGAIAWDTVQGWYRIRFIDEGERLDAVTPERRLLVELLREQLQRWAKAEAVPRIDGKTEPWTSEFWNSVGRVLTTGFRIDAPKAMDSLNNPEDVELLYEAIVQPIESVQRKRTRVEGAVTRALGSALAKSFRSRLEVAAFENAHERVLRGVRGPRGEVVIEAVNLAGRNGRRDADALVSKLQRIQNAPERDRPYLHQAIIGYVASPGGLNGEGHMKDWMVRSVTPRVFDMTREASAFREAARNCLAEIGIDGQYGLGQ